MVGAPDRDRSAPRQEGWIPDERVLELEREGRVDGYIPVLDYDGLGMQTVLVRLCVRGDLAAVLADHPDCVTDAYETSGVYDALLIARFDDLGELNGFLAGLSTDDRVTAATANVVLRTACEYEFVRLLD
ncbi:MAG: Lrp/AsnC family transcriptional regulator [Haloarculaceae archaeon]